MYISSYESKRGNRQPGFALIATMSVMILMVMVSLAMVSLSSLELRSQQHSNHQAVAQANARLALMLALSELQTQMGPDQRVSARAAILEEETATSTVANRNWLGVWSTTVSESGQDWPVIGKLGSSPVSGAPYASAGGYEDLRNSLPSLADDTWKTELRRAWLVSQQSSDADASQLLDTADSGVVEIVGRGSLGSGLNASEYQEARVLVEKVEVEGRGGYAWYVADNNQKASIDPISEVLDVDAALEASPRGNPALVRLPNDKKPFQDFTEEALNHSGKVLSYASAALVQAGDKDVREALREKYHHLTAEAPGLFTDTLHGGLRKDLTPLLLAKQGQESVDFDHSEGSEPSVFSSTYPIIPGADHGVLGPSFGALRDWAQQAYVTSNDAQTSASSSAVRMRPTTAWPHAISDGACFDASQWAESAPKVHPVMTDSRWHYYFSHHNQRIRTHIIPRVCLWNPYNRELKVPALTVLMPNPFYNLSHGMHFFPEEAHVDDLKTAHQSDSGHVFSKWIQKSGYVGGSVYKMRTNPFPESRYLAFTLEATSMGAGECHVFSPKVVTADLTASGIKLQKYQPTSVASNVLSSSEEQGKNHFFYDHAADVKYEVQATSWRSLSSTDLSEIDFGRIFDYQPEVTMQTDGKVESFPFILKSGTAPSLEDLYTSSAYPTLQLVNNAAGGAKPTTYFGYIGETWGSALQPPGSFGNLQTFAEAPLKDAPPTHQVGAKLLWLDESSTEGNAPPLRVDRWTSDHMAYNVSPVANWNIRAQLTTRSPASQCALKWYMTSTGPWLLQFTPMSPQDFNDQPSLNASGTAFVKNPFGATNSFPFSQDVVMFDLPSNDYGVLSLAKLRHAMLSPYSWNPTYLIGHSLRDLHAPAERSAHEVATDRYTGNNAPTRWDYLIGSAKGSGLSHGPYAKAIDSQGLLQIGSEAVTRKVAETQLSSADEVLAYDVAYEVNQNLWDRYFISGMPLSSDTGGFAWNPDASKPLWNTRYQFNRESHMSQTEAVAMVTATDGLNTGFWENAVVLKNKAAFNVNSTSVEAWTAFLSGTLGLERPLKSGHLESDEISFARHRQPASAAKTSEANPDKSGAWIGARKLTKGELRSLAENIVVEVKKRGPFVSISDFVNRRLCDEEDETSMMGTLDAAIQATGLNANFEKESKYLSTAVNVGTRTDAPDNNLSTFKNSYRFQKDGSYTSVQPTSQAWGMPGFLTQSDVLESIAPALAVRGDSYTIRAYGESSSEGVVHARAWIEATVERSPHYVDRSLNGNQPTDAAGEIDYATGSYQVGNLTPTNQQFGRKFVIKSQRWLNADEI